MYLALYTSSQTQCTCIIIQESSTSCVGNSVTDENQKIGCRSMPLNLCGLTKSLRTPIVHPVTYTIEGWRKVWRHDHVMSRQISRKDGKTRNIKHWASVHVQLWSLCLLNKLRNKCRGDFCVSEKFHLGCRQFFLQGFYSHRHFQ